MLKSTYKLVALCILLALSASTMMAQTEDNHCVIWSVEDGGGTLGCYSTLAEAIRIATDGKVDLPNSADMNTVDQALKEHAIAEQVDRQPNSELNMQPASSTVVGILYDWTNYQSSNFILIVSDPTGCATYGWGFNLPSTWQNRVESARGYQGCNYTQVYDLLDFQGPTYKCPNDCSTFLGLNNDADSVYVWP